VDAVEGADRDVTGPRLGVGQGSDLHLHGKPFRCALCGHGT
jgi:hypothetical protein